MCMAGACPRRIAGTQQHAPDEVLPEVHEERAWRAAFFAASLAAHFWETPGPVFYGQRGRRPSGPCARPRRAAPRRRERAHHVADDARPWRPRPSPL